MDVVSTSTAMLPALTADEIDRRVPVWEAFTDLFLDNDPAFSYGYIRRVMDESSYTREQLWLILWLEVTPAFSPNLSVVTGVWDGWEREYIRDLIVRQQSRKPWLKRLLGNLPARHYQSYVEEQWRALLTTAPQPLP